MLSPNPAVKFTYEDYQHTPEDKRYELLDGELIMVPAPNLEHQRIGIRLGALLHGFVQERGLGEVFHAPFHAPCDVVLSNTDVVQPTYCSSPMSERTCCSAAQMSSVHRIWSSKSCPPPLPGGIGRSNAPCTPSMA